MSVGVGYCEVSKVVGDLQAETSETRNTSQVKRRRFKTTGRNESVTRQLSLEETAHTATYLVHLNANKHPNIRQGDKTSQNPSLSRETTAVHEEW